MIQHSFSGFFEVATAKNCHERKLKIFRYHAHAIEGEQCYYDYPRNATQRENAFKLRYQVFCDECGFMPKEYFRDGKEKDIYDAVDSTRMLVAFDPDQENNVFGVIRAVRDPRNAMYNRHPFFDTEGNLIEKLPIEKHISVAAFRDRGRNIEQVTSLAVGSNRGKKVHFGLFKSVYLDAVDHKIDDIFIQANPAAAWLFEAIGFEKVYEGRYAIIDGPSVENNREVPVCGMHLDMHNINQCFLAYFQKPSHCFLFRGEEYIVYN